MDEMAGLEDRIQLVADYLHTEWCGQIVQIDPDAAANGYWISIGSLKGEPPETMPRATRINPKGEVEVDMLGFTARQLPEPWKSDCFNEAQRIIKVIVDSPLEGEWGPIARQVYSDWDQLSEEVQQHRIERLELALRAFLQPDEPPAEPINPPT